MSTALRVVKHPVEPAAPARPAEPSLAERIRELQAEARALARDHVEALAVSLIETRRMAAEIADGGAAFPPGVRDLAARLGEEAEARAMTLRAIMGRMAGGA